MDPEEIQNREFLVSLRGYDRDEVDAFAREVAEEIAKLRTQLTAAGSAPPAAAPEPVPAVPADRSDALKQIGEETSKILLAAEQVGSDIKDKARREAAEMLADAREEVQKINKESSERRREAEEELRKLTEARSVLATQLEDVRRRLDETISRLVAPMTPPSKAPARPAPPVLKPVPDAKPEVTKTPESEASSKTVSTPPSTKVEAPTEAKPKAVVKPPDKQKVVPAVSVSETKAPSLADVLDEVRKEREEGRKEVEAALAQVSAQPKAPEEAKPSPKAVSGDPLQARADALGDAPDTAARRMKRLLQEDQNDLLDRLRTRRGKGSLNENIPPQDEQVARFKEGLSEILGSAFREGRKLAGADGPGDVDKAVVGLITKQLVSPLRSEVSRTVEAGLEAQDTATAIAEHVSDVFRVWKGVRTEMLGEGMVHAAFHQGLIDAWRNQGSGQKKWVQDQERDCPKDVCNSNAEAGFLPVDSAFPSGHIAPPAHGGCTCTLSGSDNLN